MTRANQAHVSAEYRWRARSRRRDCRESYRLGPQEGYVGIPFGLTGSRGRDDHR